MRLPRSDTPGIKKRPDRLTIRALQWIRRESNRAERGRRRQPAARRASGEDRVRLPCSEYSRHKKTPGPFNDPGASMEPAGVEPSGARSPRATRVPPRQRRGPGETPALRYSRHKKTPGPLSDPGASMEPAGVEPASANRSTRITTCVVRCWISLPHRPANGPLEASSELSRPRPSEQQPRASPI